MQTDAATAAIIAAGVAGFFSTVTAIVVVAISKRSDERRHLLEVAVNAAIEDWKTSVSSSRLANRQIMPLDVFIIHSIKLAEVLSAKDLTVKNLESKRAGVYDLTTEAARIANEFTESISGENE